eukprot:TRINITY_DN2968_c0_g1_i2.p2 TRINITY_DN2968_c0_g1~~TRINITY_DN2968_c0_g1_i2.p2  ORF type:complete len:187 (+),score=53.94 TRINITY_DN2968_c0_g1_i2:260-820(+)
MKKEDVVQELRKRFEKADTSNINDTIAVQINLKDEDGGTLYVEVKDKVLNIEPYEYWDRNVIITIASNDLLDIIDKKMNLEQAFSDGLLTVEGDVEKALELVKLSKEIIVENLSDDNSKKEDVIEEKKPEESIIIEKSISKQPEKTITKQVQKKKKKKNKKKKFGIKGRKLKHEKRRCFTRIKKGV